MFGEHGTVTHGVLREEPDGFTLVGEGMLDVVDPETVSSEIDAAMQAQRDWYADMPDGFPNPFEERHPSETHVFKGWDDARRQREPLKHVGGAWGELSPRTFDGDRWGVVRGADLAARLRCGRPVSTRKARQKARQRHLCPISDPEAGPPFPHSKLTMIKSGRLDSNQRPPAPKAGALPDCATPRMQLQ